MTALPYIQSVILPTALSLLPVKMDTPGARAMLVAIGLQESRFEHRHQIGGPARGWWQFEEGGGVAGVLRHHASRPLILPILGRLGYDETSHEYLHEAIEHNDILACIFARLLLWTLPNALPGSKEPALGWEQYLSAWRPGRPHPDTWLDFYERAWT